MSRFKKFIESEMPNKNHKKREKKGNVFKRRRKGRRIYKSKVSREEFLNNMKAKGATINSYSIIDAINAKNKKQNNCDKTENKTKQKHSKPVNNEIVEEYDNYNEEEQQAMKNLVLLQYYEQQVEEDDEEINTENVLDTEKKNDFISF